MRPGYLKDLLVVIGLGASPLCASTAWAGLGGDAASVLFDAGRIHGVVQTTALQQYEIHEIATDSGMRVREFLNGDSRVFAVVWSGPVMPDLQPLLGSSFPAYAHALAALEHPGRQRSLRIVSSDLVVQIGGHLRAYGGRAYLPLLLPAGASTADIR